MFAIRATNDSGEQVDVVMFLAEASAENLAEQLDGIGWQCEVVPAVTLPEVAMILERHAASALPAPIQKAA